MGKVGVVTSKPRFPLLQATLITVYDAHHFFFSSHIQIIESHRKFAKLGPLCKSSQANILSRRTRYIFLMLYLYFEVWILSTYLPGSIVTPLFPTSSWSHPLGLMRNSRVRISKRTTCVILFCPHVVQEKYRGSLPKNELRENGEKLLPVINICRLNVKKEDPWGWILLAEMGLCIRGVLWPLHTIAKSL